MTVVTLGETMGLLAADSVGHPPARLDDAAWHRGRGEQCRDRTCQARCPGHLDRAGRHRFAGRPSDPGAACRGCRRALHPRWGRHVRGIVGFQPQPQVPDLPIGLISGAPRERHLRGERPRRHHHGLPWLGLELGALRDPRPPAPIRAGDPPLGQIQLPVDQRMPASTGISEEGSGLAVLDPASGAGVLPPHPGRAGAFLQEAGVVHDQHAAWLAEVLDDSVANVGANAVDVPVRPAPDPADPLPHRPPRTTIHHTTTNCRCSTSRD